MRKILFICILILLFLSLLVSCDSEPRYTAGEWEEIQEQEEENIYSIKTYKLTQRGEILLKGFVGLAKEAQLNYSEEKLLKDIIKNNFDMEYFDDNIRNELIIQTYKSTKIIDYSDKDCRFIDKNTNLEKFLSADYIEIEQIK